MEKQTLFDSVISANNLYNAWKTIQEKKSSGGVDDVSVEDYSKSVSRRLSQLQHLLETEKWLPSLYYNIEVPKVSGEVRVISLSVIEDKIVQAVDRVVLSMLRRREPCQVDADGLLDDETKKKLTSHIMERLNRHEKYRGQSRSLLNIMDLQALELAESISDRKTFKAYSAKW